MIPINVAINSLDCFFFSIHSLCLSSLSVQSRIFLQVALCVLIIYEFIQHYRVLFAYAVIWRTHSVFNLVSSSKDRLYLNTCLIVATCCLPQSNSSFDF